MWQQQQQRRHQKDTVSECVCAEIYTENLAIPKRNVRARAPCRRRISSMVFVSVATAVATCTTFQDEFHIRVSYEFRRAGLCFSGAEYFIIHAHTFVPNTFSIRCTHVLFIIFRSVSTDATTTTTTVAVQTAYVRPYPPPSAFPPPLRMYEHV